MSTVPAEADLDPAGLQLPDLGIRTSLRQQVTEALRGAVVSGVMQPGALYSAPTLAAMLGVSATPVREAMLDLAKEGLIEAVRNKGFRVTELTDAELDQLTELRSLIEVPTVAAIAERYTDAWRADIDALSVDAAEIVRCAETGDLIGHVAADRRFHLNLLGLHGNAQLVEVVGELRARSRLYGLQQLAERGLLTASAAEHQQLLDLIVAHDVERARDLMALHIGHVRGQWAGR
jgi:DNA-binding GntR family transcriptional regulator